MHRMLPLIFLLLFLPVRAEAQPEERNILVLHSYNVGQPWTDGIMAGIQKVLSPRQDLHLDVEYMDAKRYHDPTYLYQVLDTVLSYKLGHRSFDLVLLSDNDALLFALRHRQTLFAGTPIVFCGINNFQPEMIAAVPEITGVAEYPNFGKTLDLALSLHKSARRFVVISGDRNETDRQNRLGFLKAVPEFAGRAEFVFWDDLPWKDLRPRLATLRRGDLVFINALVKKAGGEIVSFGEVIESIREAAPDVPVYSAWDFFLGQGIVGGRLVSSERQGYLAAQLALRVLDGENAGAIPVVTRGTNSYMFDDRELRRFGISRKALPPGSTLVHLPVPFIHLNRLEVWFAVGLGVLLLGAVGGLLLALARQRRAEAALRESEKELRHVNEELDAFVRTVSHDLRSQLTPVIGFAEFLRKEYGEKMDITCRELLGQIERQGRRMHQFLEDLLSLARVGHLEVPREPVDSLKVAREVLIALTPRLAELKTRVELLDLPSVFMPPFYLQQALENLLRNALCYGTPPGGTIEVGGKRHREKVSFFVRDHGPGVPDAEKEKIFELFFRGSSGQGKEGTGVGLGTVRRIARRCGGNAWVEDTPGGGATFWLEVSSNPPSS